MFRAEPLRDPAGTIVAWYGINADIKDRKRAEIGLQRSEADAAEAQKLSLTGSFAWEIASGDSFWSDQTYNILGHGHTVKPSLEQIVERVHPDDRARPPWAHRSA
jgi:hypothetical protein